MSKQLRAVRSEDLVVGKEYYDIPEISEEPCVLRFVGNDEDDDPVFEHVSGPEVYMKDNEGHVLFFSGREFYEQTEA